MCSGATKFAISQAASRFGTSATTHPSAMILISASERESLEAISGRSPRTSSTSFLEVVTRNIFSLPLPCSACESMSETTNRGFAEESASTRISLGPGRRSTPTVPKSWRFASTT